MYHKTTVYLSIAAASCTALVSPPLAGAQTTLAPQATLTARPAQEVNAQPNLVMAQPPEREAPVRHTMGEAAFLASKSRVNGLYAPGQTKSITERLATSLAPVIKTTNMKGHGSTEGLRPPDTHGARGTKGFVEATNSHVDMWGSFAGGVTKKGVTLATFFNYTAQTIFDPRVIYDSSWNRWVITAEAFAESATVQYYFIAVSKTADPTGAFWIYQINIDIHGNNDFFDFPQVGMDQDAILITANIFPAAGGYAGADFFAVAKTILYNGRGFSVPIFEHLTGTLAPPIVIDQGASTFLLAAPPSGTTLTKYTVTNSSHAFAMSVSAPVSITVTSYNVPPDAPQPGTADLLDTGDARFVNNSTQNGNDLWQTHTVAGGSFAIPKFYRINTNANTVSQTGSFFASASSFDFNASITANTGGDCFVTYTSTDTASNIRPQTRASGKLNADSGIPAGPNCATSAFSYNASGDTTERWGDYSAITLDPLDGTAWLVNETPGDGALWGSRIVNIGF
jgi:hypothetical protein